MAESDKSQARRRNGIPPLDGEGKSTDGRSPAEHFAALRADFTGLEEVCRWQWNLIRRLQGHLSGLPREWPPEPEER